MKINDAHQKLLEAYLNQAQAAQGPAQAQGQQAAQQGAGAPKADKVDLSSGSKLLQQVNEAMRAEEPGRAERVQAIGREVQAGTYQVRPEQVANRMLTDLIKDMG